MPMTSWSHATQAADHHPLLATAPALDAAGIAAVDQIYRDRWGTLFSIDDMVAEIHAAVANLGIAEQTYMMYERMGGENAVSSSFF